MNRYRILPLVLVLLASSAAFALHVSNRVYYISESVNDPELRASLATVERLAEQGQFAQAASTMVVTVHTASPAGQGELNAADAARGPLSLHAQVARIQYLGMASQWHDPEIETAARTALGNYAEMARGEDWEAYFALYKDLVSYHGARRDAAAVNAVYIEGLSYAPANETWMAAYLNWAVSQRHPIDLAAVLAKIGTYDASGGRITADIALMHTQLRAANDPLLDLFPAGIERLQTYPSASPQSIEKAIEFMRVRLDSSRPDRVRQFYQTLTVLAIKQPSGEKRIGLTAAIMNERKKLEAIMPELRE